MFISFFTGKVMLFYGTTLIMKEKSNASALTLTGSYISYVEEDDFLADIDKYIDNAFDKSENDASGYDINPTR